MKTIQIFCLTLVVISIMIGSTIAILAIWGAIDTQEVLWKSIATCGVMAASSFITMLVTAYFSKIISYFEKQKDAPVNSALVSEDQSAPAQTADNISTPINVAADQGSKQ